MVMAPLHGPSALQPKPPGKPAHLIPRREIGEEQRAERVNDCGKREQHRTVVESKTVAAAIDDPAPKRANQGPHNECRKGGKDHSTGGMHPLPVLRRRAYPGDLNISQTSAAVALGPALSLGDAE